VVDKRTGELSQWPSLGPSGVAERYRVEKRAEERFPPDVRKVLTDAGWHPGRDVSARIRLWLKRVYAEHPGAEERLPIFPAAMDALTEFGGLKFNRKGRPDGFRVELWPDVGRVVVDLYTEFGSALGVPVFPFAYYEDGPSDAVVDERGRVFLLHPASDYLVGRTVDEAIIGFARGPDLKMIDERGELVPEE
jgi:hypothetical protein